MGESYLAETLGRTLEEVRPLFKRYHETLPFVKNTYELASRRAAQTGFITTILGRRRRFDTWEVATWDNKEKGKLYASAEAVLAARPDATPRRAFTHKALNALLQGSAADAMKKAMVQLWESGVCEALGAPLLTVHDELDWSFAPQHRAVLEEVKRIMEDCIPLRIPLLASLETGPNWGDCV